MEATTRHRRHRLRQPMRLPSRQARTSPWRRKSPDRLPKRPTSRRPAPAARAPAAVNPAVAAAPSAAPLPPQTAVAPAPTFPTAAPDAGLPGRDAAPICNECGVVETVREMAGRGQGQRRRRHRRGPGRRPARQPDRQGRRRATSPRCWAPSAAPIAGNHIEKMRSRKQALRRDGALRGWQHANLQQRNAARLAKRRPRAASERLADDGRRQATEGQSGGPASEARVRRPISGGGGPCIMAATFSADSRSSRVQFGSSGRVGRRDSSWSLTSRLPSPPAFSSFMA
jgi:hypothetical protein